METILKWCSILHFPQEWQEEIAKASKDFDYNKKPKTYMDHLLVALYDCEKLSEKYKDAGIDERILRDTLNDITVWVKNHYLVNGEIGLSEIEWIKNHINMQVFRLGRLQFKFGKMNENCDRLGLFRGESIIEVHVPQGEPLDIEKCEQSFRMAIKFFEKYYPKYKYRYFTCHSWLLDLSLNKFLSSQSNIIKFQKLFEVISYQESPQAMERIFKLSEKKDGETSLQKKVRKYVKEGGKLFEGYGVIKRTRFCDPE